MENNKEKLNSEIDKLRTQLQNLINQFKEIENSETLEYKKTLIGKCFKEQIDEEYSRYIKIEKIDEYDKNLIALCTYNITDELQAYIKYEKLYDLEHSIEITNEEFNNTLKENIKQITNER